MKINTKNTSHLLWAALAAASFFAGKSITDDRINNPASPADVRTRKLAVQKVERAANHGLDARANHLPRASTREMEDDPVQGQLEFLQLLSDLSPGNISAALARLKARGPDSLEWQHNAGLLFHTWALRDPEAALAMAAEFSGTRKDAALAGALTGFATSDPQEARRWLEDRDADAMQTAAVVKGIAQVDPDEATRFVTGMPAESRNRDLLLEVIATEQIKRGLSEADRWARGLEDPDLRETALAGIARKLTSGEGADAGARWIEKHAALPEAAEAIEVVAREWARNDAAAAARWLNSLPGEAGNPALAEVIAHWTTTDPAAAGGFLNGLTDSPARSEAVFQFAVRLARRDPVSACEWAATIQDSRLRASAVRTALRQWVRDDPAAASQWKARNGV